MITRPLLITIQYHIISPMLFISLVCYICIFIRFDSHTVTLPVNLQQKVAFDTHYTNKFLIRICSRTHYKSLEHTKELYEIVSR